MNDYETTRNRREDCRAIEAVVGGDEMKVGGKYNWKCQPERLVYLGYNWSGNGFWHQFAKVETPDVVWCEVLTRDLHMLEETTESVEPPK